MSIKDRTCIVGIGQTEWGNRRQFTDLTANDLIRIAFDRALADCGLDRKDVDGLSTYHGSNEAGIAADLARHLGMPKVNYSSTVYGGGGGGAAGAVGNAAAAVAAGYADVVACFSAIASYVPPAQGGSKARFATGWTRGADPWLDFQRPFGLVAPGQMFAMMFRRHMHLYGTNENQLAEVAMTHRFHAQRNPAALKREPMTREDYFSSRMISTPFRLFDFCLESVGAVVILVASAERARDLKQKPVYIMGASQGGDSNWGRGMMTQNQPGDLYTSTAGRHLAERMYGQAGITARDIDVAQFYDHFSGIVIMQLEDWGFCERGEGGPFVENGGIRFDTGRMPVNTSGGQLSEMYLTGIPHVLEATKQMRGTSTSQVKDAEIALVTSGPSPLPISALLLRR